MPAEEWCMLGSGLKGGETSAMHEMCYCLTLSLASKNDPPLLAL